MITSKNSNQKPDEYLHLFPIIKTPQKRKLKNNNRKHATEPLKKKLGFKKRMMKQNGFCKENKNKFHLMKNIKVKSPNLSKSRSIFSMIDSLKQFKSFGNSPSKKLFSIHNNLSANKNFICQQSPLNNASCFDRLYSSKFSKASKKIKKLKIEMNANKEYKYQTPLNKHFSQRNSKLKNLHYIKKLNKKKKDSKIKLNQSLNKINSEFKTSLFQLSIDVLNSTLDSKIKPYIHSYENMQTADKNSAILNKNVISFNGQSKMFSLESFDNQTISFDFKKKYKSSNHIPENQTSNAKKSQTNTYNNNMAFNFRNLKNFKFF